MIDVMGDPILTATSVGTEARPSGAAGGIRSMRGAVGALLLLLALPITIAVQIVAPASDEVVIHFALAAGTLIIGLSVFDFTTSRRLNTAACVAAIVLAAIFLAQGLGALTQSEILRNAAYSRAIGAWAEDVTLTIIMLWFMAVATTLRRGVTMWLGVASAGAVAGLSTWALIAGPATGTPELLRLLFVLPIAWFLFVSTRRLAGRELGFGH